MKTPSKLEYIGVLLLVGIISKLTSSLILESLGYVMIINRDDILPTFFLAEILSTFLAIGTFIFIYNMFSTLNIKRVMLYVYALAFLGTLIDTALFLEIASSENVSESLGLIPILSFAVYVLGIRAYYINKPDRWY